MAAYSERYRAALILAAQAHRHQNRKIGDVPYIVHPVHTSIMLIRYGFSEDVAVAALLHDIVEDTDMSLADVEAGFGPNVARIVAALTEHKRESGASRPWETRKQEALDQLRHSNDDVVAVKAADTLDSVSGLAIAIRRHGSGVWDHFSRGSTASLWFYRSVVGVVSQRLGNHPLAGELAAAVKELAQAVDETGKVSA
ncbi:MAG: HD domain-containing protein [Anaerolineae bacterium]|jgi:(p)ppGpp synthase/HD superfamily hydrolase